MKKKFLLLIYILISALITNAQGVTQLNNNNSLQVQIPLSNGKTILTSNLDSSIWATDGTPGNTIQISTTIKYDAIGSGGLLSGKLIFSGKTAVTGSELYITDGTSGGTLLVSDINPGNASSNPRNFSLLNGFLYFTADDGSHGRELWRTDGTTAGTTLVKDIQTGALGSFDLTEVLYSTGSYLLFSAFTSASGYELWKSDGTGVGTVMLKEINTATSNTSSSNPREFYPYNNMVLFLASDETHGEELWETDGSSGGTVMVKDINPGVPSSTTFTFFGTPGAIFTGFHTFKNHVFFNASDGTSNGQLWSTDGTTANTILISDVIHTTSIAFTPVSLSENLPNKFIFPASDLATRCELWESDGTPAGTKLFKAFPVVGNHTIPFIFPTFSLDFTSQTFTQPLFQGNKFFFMAATPTEGNELWVSDGTLPGTSMVKDINAGTGDGIDPTKSVTFLYTSNSFYFAGTDGTHGDELWKTDGTAPGTSMVADINPNAGDANPELPIFLSNGKIIFTATDGDNTKATDLFAVNGSFSTLPVKLIEFTVNATGNDALLQWRMQTEINSQSFTVQRSYDGQHFEDIGNVISKGIADHVSNYTFTDYGILNIGKALVYYRLNEIDKDGKSVFSEIIHLKISGNNHWSIHLLSNPVTDYVNLMVSDVSGGLKLSIIDISGKIVYTKIIDNVNGQITLPVMLQKGIYFLEAQNNNEIKTIKFIK